jgi:DNA-binding transcriptional LysR family regulator
MGPVQLNQLTAFVAVAEHRSFTKAAAQVGISKPTMSLTINALEQRLGVRLFNRTTRNVALTVAGERLLAQIQPILEGIDQALDSVNSFRDKPIGTLRLTVARPIALTSLAPIVQPFLAEYPAIRLEVAFDDTHSDIVSGRFDAGIRVGHRVERDMTVLRLTDEFKVFVVAAPTYLEHHTKPLHPKDLHFHNCILFRLPWDGSVQTWILKKGSEQTEIAVEGSLTVNDVDFMLSAALDGVGIGYLPETMIATHVAAGRLIVLLDGWSRTIPGFYLYHPSRRQTPMPLQVFLRFIEKWRKRPLPASRDKQIDCNVSIDSLTKKIRPSKKIAQ